VQLHRRRYEPIPYDIKQRIAWYLEKQTSRVEVTKLVWDVGLSKSYCRAIPRLIRDMPGARQKIVFQRDLHM
jgi:hypothetical protein